MWLKYPIIIIFFLIAALLKAGFLPYIAIMGTVPNLIFILFFVVVFFEQYRILPQYSQELFLSGGILMAIIAGLLLDMSSPFWFGSSIIALLVLYFLIKTGMRYLDQRDDRYLLFYFVSVFLGSFVAYVFLSWAFAGFADTGMSFNSRIIVKVAYNLAAAIILCYAYKYASNGQASGNRQLKLFS